MISYAHEGKLVQGLSCEELRSILSTLLVKTSRSDKRVAQQAALEKQLEKKNRSPMITRSQFRSLLARLVDNLGWKIVSLLLSIGLWIVIRIAVVEEYEASQVNRGPMAIRQIQNVPIIIQTSSTDTNRYVIEPQVVAVSVEGQSVLLETLDATRIRVVADLTQQAGEEAFAVALEVEVPDDFAFRSCQPQSIRVGRGGQ